MCFISNSFGGNVISAFATEVFFSNLGKIDRLSLLDPGNMVSKYEVQGEYKAVEGKQYGFVNKVRSPFLPFGFHNFILHFTLPPI